MFRLLTRQVVLLGLLLLALAPAGAQAQSCFPTVEILCLNNDRFQVEVAWSAPGFGEGKGQAVPLTADTGLFWFFDNANLELVIKVLDGREVNGHFWVYYGGLSDVEYTIKITDKQTGATETYPNPPGQLVSRADTSAFEPEPKAQAGVVAAGLLGKLTPAPPPPPPGLPLRIGPELQLNELTRGNQYSPDVAVGIDGSFLAVWDSDGAGVRSRLFDRFGSPRTAESRLDAQLPLTFNFSPRVAASSDGGEYMVVWRTGERIAGRILGANGQPLGPEFAIGSGGHYQVDPTITAEPTGGFLVAWTDAGPGPSIKPTALRWQRFSDQGVRVGQEIVVPRPGFYPKAAALNSGGFVMTWAEAASSSPQPGIRALRLDSQARPVSADALRVNADVIAYPYYLYGAVPVPHNDGGFSVLWAGDPAPGRPGFSAIFARRYTATGEPVAGVTVLRTGKIAERPVAVPLPATGDFLVVWEEYLRIEDRDAGVFTQSFSPEGLPRGKETRVNTYTHESQVQPSVAADSGGNIVAVWMSGTDIAIGTPPPGFGEDTQDGHLFGVFGQRFTLANCAESTATQLCLGGRFRAEVEVINPWTGLPEAARPVPLTSDTGAFWFFQESNVELVVKILDGQGYNGYFWLYAGALSDVEYTLKVTDTLSGEEKTYSNKRGQLTSRADVTAFSFY